LKRFDKTPLKMFLKLKKEDDKISNEIKEEGCHGQEL